MSIRQPVSRRKFLAAAGAAVVAPTFIPASALGKDGRPAPSNRIALGCIGLGTMGRGNTNSFMKEKDCQIVALCDVDKEYLKIALDQVNGHYGDNGCATYHDFRELIGREDIDAVMIATPDHWHSIPAIAAANAGKDIYGEKPIAHTLVEGRAMVDAVEKNDRIWQTGSWQRSVFNFRQACELVLNGKIGKVHRAEVGLPPGHSSGLSPEENPKMFQPTDPPDYLDYDFWLGPARELQYYPARHRSHWRWHYALGGGQLMDWIGHHMDIAHWGLGFNRTGPHEIQATGDFPPRDAIWNTATHYRVTCQYPDDIEVVITDAPRLENGGNAADGTYMGTKWIGEDGWVFVDRGKFEASDKDLLKWEAGPNDVQLYKSPGHHRNFLDCVKSREQTLTPAEVAHRSVSPGHLGYIAMRLGRKLRWDPDTETIQDDPEATAMLGYDMREPWSL